MAFTAICQPLAASRRCPQAIGSGRGARQAPPAAMRASLLLPTTASRSPRHQRASLLCRAAGGDEQQPQQPPAEQQQQQQAAIPPKVTPVEDPAVAKGQRTAIITGAISIIFGVIYLALVSFLDIRGGELLPPPPEAYLP